jgi:sec-independent protein translocase protein TatC
MTLGEHLEELRSRLIRVIAAVIVATVFCFLFRSQTLGFLVWQIFAVLRIHGQEATLNYLSPTEPLILDLKIAVILGMIISAPYGLIQIWGFIAAGLYAHERRWVNRFAPASVILFFVGALFFVIVVFPVMLGFLISYRQEIPDIGRYMPQVVLPGAPTPVTPDDRPFAGEPPLPAFQEDPADPPEGVPWLNTLDRELRIRFGDKIYTVAHLKEGATRNRLEATLRISEFIVLELQMAAAFGLGFQVPVIIAFLAAVGIVESRVMGQYRRHVWLIMAVGAAMITPPDVISMILLLVPMGLLFEVGLVVARFIERERTTET